MMKQFEILNDISNIAFEIADGEYDELVISVEVDAEVGFVQMTASQETRAK